MSELEKVKRAQLLSSLPDLPDLACCINCKRNWQLWCPYWVKAGYGPEPHWVCKDWVEGTGWRLPVNPHEMEL